MLKIVFDMDGLMFDTGKVFAEAWDYAGEKMGMGKAGYMIYKTMGMSIASSSAIWKAEFGNCFNPDELRRYTKDFLQDYYKRKSVPVKNGLYELLAYLKEQGAKLAVASSSPRWEVEHHLKDAGIYDYFAVVVCGDMVQKSKPDPEIYLTACELLETKPEDVYALEDSQSGLMSAYCAGCKPIMIPDLWQPDEEILKIITGKYAHLSAVKEAFVTGQLTEKAGGSL